MPCERLPSRLQHMHEAAWQEMLTSGAYVPLAVTYTFCPSTSPRLTTVLVAGS